MLHFSVDKVVPDIHSPTKIRDYFWRMVVALDGCCWR